MDLTEILAVDSIRAPHRVTSKKRLIQDISGFCAQIHGLDEQTLFEALQERENLGATGMGEGVAIPHARLEGLEKVYGAFFALEQAVDFDAIDRKPVDLVFVLLAPANAGADHLKALARVSRTFREEQVRAKLRSTQDPSALYAILTEPATSHKAA